MILCGMFVIKMTEQFGPFADNIYKIHLLKLQKDDFEVCIATFLRKDGQIHVQKEFQPNEIMTRFILLCEEHKRNGNFDDLDGTTFFKFSTKDFIQIVRKLNEDLV